MTNVAIVGVGLHPFGRHEGVTGLQMGALAVRAALADAGVSWPDIQFAYGGSFRSGAADALVAHLGLTGMRFINVHNGCATSTSALAAACDAIGRGRYDLGVVVGFDRHPRGAFDFDPAFLGLGDWYGQLGLMQTPQFFAMRCTRYMHDHGISPQVLTKVAAKNRENGALNPNAWRRSALSEEQIAGSRMLNHPFTQYMFCSPGEGGAALVVCRADLAHRYTSHPVYVRGVAIRTRKYGSFNVFSPSLPPGHAESPTEAAARDCYEMAGIEPGDVDIAQLQDSEPGSEIIAMAETGLCADGEQEAMVRAGETRISGRLPVNTDGGLIANGEPIGASGLRQIHELVLQLRGTAGARQMPRTPRVGLAQVYGIPGTSGATLLSS
ncbi:acetyl-CoA acetyltransferase [Kibdelosporangium banguiense]|uniref:Acetyl-CoA acetyltransferase n=1 Tax=Kibdelosporangium banguiense TaxID=1365924 RepID=A0ABS4TUI5_9PSEU|nr:thiolase family protein [Kibdelosporangium banguiense]MBP2328052.1 acetyl-CoA acetyltransferase [Kibdelosporangium banguiense]